MNLIELRGFLEHRPTYTHKYCGEMYYESKMIVPRKSGIIDVLPISVPQSLMDKFDGSEEIKVVGKIVTPMKNRKVFVKILCTEITNNIESLENRVDLQGVAIGNAIYRTTPNGRRITNIILNVDGNYIPCIFWGKNAVLTSGVTNGEEISLDGRLQSRDYCKNDSIMTTYEVSVSRMKVGV